MSKSVRDGYSCVRDESELALIFAFQYVSTVYARQVDAARKTFIRRGKMRLSYFVFLPVSSRSDRVCIQQYSCNRVH